MAAKKTTLAEMVERERNEVHAALQLWGEFPECNPKCACELDWIFVLQSQLTDVTEHARLIDTPDRSHRQERYILRKHLARIIATCEAWEKELRKP